jgi:hypothetical protein
MRIQGLIEIPTSYLACPPRRVPDTLYNFFSIFFNQRWTFDITHCGLPAVARRAGKKRDSLWDVFRLIHKFPLQPSTLT